MMTPWLTLSCTVANTGESCFSVLKIQITVAIIDQIELSNDEFDL